VRVRVRRPFYSAHLNRSVAVDEVVDLPAENCEALLKSEIVNQDKALDAAPETKAPEPAPEPSDIEPEMSPAPEPAPKPPKRRRGK
jgi:hypothetical protein